MDTVNFFRRAAFAAAITWLAVHAAVGVAQQPDVQVVLTQQKVRVGADGKEILEPAERAAPGDVIEYRATYTNRTKDTVRNLVATLPLPSETVYEANSARPAGVLASSGGTYGPVPLKRKVRGADGKEVERDVPLAEYRSLQWNVGQLAAGASTTVSARIRLTPVATTVPASAPAR